MPGAVQMCPAPKTPQFARYERNRMRLAATWVVANLVLCGSTFAMGKRVPPPPGSIAGNVAIVTPRVRESCAIAPAFSAPAGLSLREGRLPDALRLAARRADSLGSLLQSARSFL